MCGIVGFTGESPRSEKIIDDMMELIRHRGPDCSGEFSDDFVTIGFRGLAGTGLLGEGQPARSADESVVIFIDGTIYNHKELGAELAGLGRLFDADDCLSTLVSLYEEYGIDMVKQLRGVFAILIYDRKSGKLYIARDHFGMKSFYYSLTDDGLIFGSEIKSFMKHPGFRPEVNLAALETYLSFQCSSMDESMFKGVYRLPPGHYLEYGDGKLQLSEYFRPMFKKPVSYSSMQQAADEIDKAIMESVKLHLADGAEVGSLLSGGVDSSYIAAAAGVKKTFTIGFDFAEYNETGLAKELSRQIGAENFVKMITAEEYWDILPTVQYFMDEPLADPATIALYFGARAAKEHMKTVMSGEGSDEFFGGYNIYKEPLDLRPLTKLPKPVRKFLAGCARLLPFDIKGKNFFIRGAADVEERFIGNANIFTVAERRAILKNPAQAPTPQEITAPLYNEVREFDDVTKMQYVDIRLWLVNDILLNVDKMGMAHSLEIRTPLLDKEIFAMAAGLPSGYRVNKKTTKAAFRLASEAHLPSEVANRKKLGIPVPIRIWLREDRYYEMVRESFTGAAAELFFNTDRLLALLNAHKSGKSDESRKIWTVYMFLLWYGRFFGDERVT